MSHWPEFLLVAKANRPGPDAGPVGSSSLLQAASVVISRAHRAAFTNPPSGSRSQIGPAGALSKEGRSRPRPGALAGSQGTHQYLSGSRLPNRLRHEEERHD